MIDEPDSPLDETAQLRRGPTVPPALEARVAAALRTDGLIRSGRPWSRVARVAAALLLFTAGASAGYWLSPTTPTTRSQAPAPSRYLLLLAGDVTPPADGSTRASEYGAWARSLALRGISVSGEELTDHAAIVTHDPDATFPDLAAVGGYFLIEASDDAAAAALARTCPHVKYGGSVIVRRVTPPRDPAG
jgi:hypothetical protein